MIVPTSTDLRSGAGAGAAGLYEGVASFSGVRAHGVVEYADLNQDPQALDAGGWWAVAADFEGAFHAWRFADVSWDEPGVVQGVTPGTRPWSAPHPPHWCGPRPGAWSSSMTREQYLGGVTTIREHVRAGRVYQVNLCRVLTAPLAAPDGGEPDAHGLAAILAAGNPAPYGGMIHVPAGQAVPGAWVVTASPELSLEVERGLISSGPIKGTARSAGGLSEKDRAENLMITDLVRNDLQRVCRPGTVSVTELLAVEEHPGLVHLVSRVRGRLREGERHDGDQHVPWASVLAATHPPGSVSGAPKHSALEVISELEDVPRRVYCGQVGWIDATARRARLAVGIRTFWWEDGFLHFGTGAGITWDSDAESEWDETELKAARLVALASAGADRSVD